MPKTQFINFMPLRHVFVFCLMLILWGCAQSPLSPPTALLPENPIEVRGAAAEWRAINRLTYGPTPALLADMKTMGQPKSWALTQLEAARKASLEAPKLPPDLASINASLPMILMEPEKNAKRALPSLRELASMNLSSMKSAFNLMIKTRTCFTTAHKLTRPLHGAWPVAAATTLNNPCWLE